MAFAALVQRPEDAVAARLSDSYRPSPSWTVAWGPSAADAAGGATGFEPLRQ